MFKQVIMSNIPQYRIITTTDGNTIHLVEIPGETAKPHSIDGPAWIYADGKKEYYIYGLKHSQLSWEKSVSFYKTKRSSIDESN